MSFSEKHSKLQFFFSLLFWKLHFTDWHLTFWRLEAVFYTPETTNKNNSEKFYTKMNHAFKLKNNNKWIQFCARSWKTEKVTILPWQGRIPTTVTDIFWDSDTASMFWPAPIQAWFPSQSCTPRTRHCSNKKSASNQKLLAEAKLSR